MALELVTDNVHTEFELFCLAHGIEVGDTVILKQINSADKILGILIGEDALRNPIIKTDQGKTVTFNHGTLQSVGYKPTLRIFAPSKSIELRLADLK